MNRLVFLLASLSLVALAACAGAAAPFTAEEIAAIQAKLGVLPAQPPADATNRVADNAAAAKLGQQLFFDARYSSTGQTSCATCHNPTTGFQDARANTSVGVNGVTGRHAPSVFNVAYGSGVSGETPWNFWDGRKDSEWAQALGPPENPVEMGGTRTKVAYLIVDKYSASYEAVFGALPAALRASPRFPLDAMPGSAAWTALAQADRDAITSVYVNFGKAIAAYERLIVSRNSRFDKYYAEFSKGDYTNPTFNADERSGLALFVGKAKCAECHLGPNFTDWKFHNIGVAQKAPNVPMQDQGRTNGVESVKHDEFNCLSAWSDQPNKATCAVASLSSTATDQGAFRTPTLRSITKTAPYLHTGALTTLEEVVALYDKGGAGEGYVGTLDKHVAPLKLNAQEQAQLVAFLKTLDGEELSATLNSALTSP